jgi:hypothetical protein
MPKLSLVLPDRGFALALQFYGASTPGTTSVGETKSLGVENDKDSSSGVFVIATTFTECRTPLAYLNLKFEFQPAKTIGKFSY